MDKIRYFKRGVVIVVLLIFTAITLKSYSITIDVFNSNNKNEQIWSIGIYEGEDISELSNKEGILNPILTASDVTDRTAKFVADPFIKKYNDINYLFFEILDSKTNKGVIGLAKSNDLYEWTYDKVVLEEEFHLSYPYVFEYEDEFYMLPEGGEGGYLSLYKANDFPYGWQKVSDLLRGNYPDASIFRYNDKWWILSTKKDDNGGYFDNLHLYYSKELLNGWIEHPNSPLLTNDLENSRPAGRILIEDDKIIRFAQNDKDRYGRAVRAFEITELSESSYSEKYIGEILTGSGIDGQWNEGGMHQIDINKEKDNNYMAIVDGDYNKKYNLILENYKRKIKSILNIDNE